MGTVRVAGVGAGYFSQFHIEAWTSMSDVEYVGVCDADAQRARAMAERFGVPEFFTDAAEMLALVKPDIFDIVTPPATHAALVELACAQRVATICQKALAPTYAEALAIVENSERAGIMLAVHENFRWQPWYREARRLLDTGQLGMPHAIAFRLRPGDGQGPEAYLERQPYFVQMERFLVYETAIHFIDTFRYLMGEVRAIFASLRRINPAIAGEDAGYIVFDFANGSAGLFDGNRLNDHTSDDPRRTMGEMWLEGSAGVLRLDGAARLWWKPHHAAEAEHIYDSGPATFGGGCVRALQEHVVRHLTAHTPLENSGADYLANLRVQDAVYQSHAEGRRITFS